MRFKSYYNIIRTTTPNINIVSQKKNRFQSIFIKAFYLYLFK